MKHKWRIIICLFLVAIFSMQALLIAYAEGLEPPETNPVIEEYVNIDNYNCSCYISGLKIYASANMSSNSSLYLQITCELQKLKSGSYETIETWTKSKTGTYIDLSENCMINLLSTYRVNVTFTAGSESTTAYSYA